MRDERLPPPALLLAFGLTSFLLAGLSIVDMFLPRPYDGVVLEADTLGELRVREVVPGSGADRAGIRHGDQIVGIAREVLRSPSHAARQINRHAVGETVPYLLRNALGVREVSVELGRRRIGDSAYLYACVLGFSFFFIGLFVLFRQSRLHAAQVFFFLSSLFMLFLICRLRPASYSWVDLFTLSTGTAALLFLPATFLHFFLIFPRPIWQAAGTSRAVFTLPRTLAAAALGTVYLLPPLVYVASGAATGHGDVPLISGAPAANWWVLAGYMLLGLAALAVNAARLDDPRERRGALLVFFGSLFGLVPFLVTAVAFPSLLHTEKLLFYGVFPLVLVPLTFAYAIVRFQLLDIRVILRKSLLYTASTAVVTGLYAVGIASFNLLARGTAMADSPYFPIVFALVIVLLFEPLRHRLQGPLDRFFFAERARLQRAMMEIGEGFSAHADLGGTVRELVERLPQILGLHFAALYLHREQRLERVAGPDRLPLELPLSSTLRSELRRRGGLAPLARLDLAATPEAAALAAQGAELLGHLASPRREVGLVVLSGKTGQLGFEDEELGLLRGLLHQASIALETSLLLEERMRQAELERELEIAASIQASLLPSSVELAPGWEVAAVCRPARHVGGDFIAKLPGPHGCSALAYGDVSGKSVSGALVMMAAYEILASLAMTARDPEELLHLANQRLYRFGRKSFVALGYFCPAAGNGHLSYVLAGQPQPLHRRASGCVTELPLPEHRLPLGALAEGRYRALTAAVAPGELILGYSDGVVETRSSAGEFFGLERLLSVLASAPASPDGVIGHVIAAVDEFSGGEEPYDDLTLVALRRSAESPTSEVLP